MSNKFIAIFSMLRQRPKNVVLKGLCWLCERTFLRMSNISRTSGHGGRNSFNDKPETISTVFNDF